MVFRNSVVLNLIIVRVHSGHLNECGSAPGGHHLVGQAAECRLTFESTDRLL